MSGNTNMRPAGYRSKFGTTAKTAREYWNIYCFAIARLSFACEGCS